MPFFVGDFWIVLGGLAGWREGCVAGGVVTARRCLVVLLYWFDYQIVINQLFFC